MGNPRNGARQIGGRVKRTGPHDRPGNFSGIPVFPALSQEIPQLRLGKFVDQLFCRHAGFWVHPHVERTGLLETESPFGPVHLGEEIPRSNKIASAGPSFSTT